MTTDEFWQSEIADALNRLALAIAALVIVLIIMSWSLDDMALRVSVFGLMLRRVAPRHPDDAAPTAAKEQ